MEGYQLNGNIKKLTRKDAAGTPIDNLTYNYVGNRLGSMNDAGTAAGVKSGMSNYSYDASGNTTNDGNRQATITYNYLNLPKTVTAAGKAFRYDYDAGGTKHKYYAVNAADTLHIKYVKRFEFNKTTNPMQIHQYQNILAENLYLYPSGNSPNIAINEHEKEVASNIACTQYAFDGPGVNADYNALFEECSEYLYQLFFSEKRMNYYIILLNKESKNTDRRVMHELNADNFQKHIHYLVDSRSCFVMSSHDNLLNKKFVEDVIKNFLLPGTYNSIDYLQLILHYCSNQATIYKMSGDGTDNYIAIDAFAKA